MKSMVKPSRLFKALLLTGLFAGPMLAFNAMAQNREDDHWSPLDTFTDVNGNQAAYYNDPGNWSEVIVPVIYDTNQVNTYFNAAFDSAAVICDVTNDSGVGQLMCGFGGGGTIEINTGAHFTAGFHNGGDWTGIGFVAGPGTLIVDPGADFTCASHLWVGQGNNDVGTVIINGGTLHIPNGQLGVSWNGTGGTNHIYITNGGSLFMSQWSSQTLGAPGSGAANFGVMDIGANSTVIITNNQTGFMNTLVTNNQLIGFEGTGSVQYSYDPIHNITTLIGLAPAGPPTPIFSVNPSNTVVPLGGTATFTATASPETGYSWLFNGTPLTDGNGISGSQTATLTVANVTAAETGIYSVTATNSAGSTQYRLYATSLGASLSANSINLYPVVTVNGINGDTYTVQWTASLTPPVTWSNLATVTLGNGPDYIVDPATPRAVQRFYQVVQQ